MKLSLGNRTVARVIENGKTVTKRFGQSNSPESVLLYTVISWQENFLIQILDKKQILRIKTIWKKSVILEYALRRKQ